MSSIAEKSLIKSTRKLFKNIDNDADFTLVSQENDEFQVHSYILKQRSEVLKRMLNHDFKESANHTIDFKDFSTIEL